MDKQLQCKEHAQQINLNTFEIRSLRLSIKIKMPIHTLLIRCTCVGGEKVDPAGSIAGPVVGGFEEGSIVGPEGDIDFHVEGAVHVQVER